MGWEEFLLIRLSRSFPKINVKQIDMGLKKIEHEQTPLHKIRSGVCIHKGFSRTVHSHAQAVR